MRDQALHALGDGSPAHLEERVVEEVEKPPPGEEEGQKDAQLLQENRKVERPMNDHTCSVMNLIIAPIRPPAPLWFSF